MYLTIYCGLVFSGALSAGRVRFRRFLFSVFVPLLFAFVAFRYEVGCDWSGYELNFETARYFTITEAIAQREPGFWSVLAAVHTIGLEYPYVNVVLAIPFFWGLAHIARRQPDPLGFVILSFPVLIINMPMSALRQSAAIGLMCFAFVAFQKRDLVRFVAFILAAGLFHFSALAFLALAPFTKYRVSRWSIAASLVLVLPGAYFALADAFSIYVDRYVGTSIDAAGAVYRSGMLAATAALFFLVLRRPFRQWFPAEYQLALIGAWVMLATLPMAFVSSVIADRFGYYVTPIQLMILARISYLVKWPSALLLSASPYAAFGLMLVVWTNLSWHFQQCYVPYQTWLSWAY